MKKRLCFLLALLLCLAVQAGCSGQTASGDHSAAPQATPDVANRSYGFGDYGEMMRAFRKRISAPGTDTIQEMKSLLGQSYTDFVDRVCEDGWFPHPLMAGEPIPYRSQDGFSNVTFLVSELYGLPWVWYYPEVATGENFYIKVTYLPGGTTEKNASEVIRALSPDAPNLDRKGEHHKQIYEKTLKLADREVTALILEYRDDNRSSTLFVYGDLLVELRSDLTVWDETWLLGLSFGRVAE